MRTNVLITIRWLCPSQDVTCRVVIAVGHVPAGATRVGPDRERLTDDLATLRALLRANVRRYFDHPATSFFRFEAEYVRERGPARIGYGFGEMAVLEHV